MIFSRNEATSIASLINVASDKKDTATALQGVKVSIKDGKVTAYATNRYIMARLVFDSDWRMNEDADVLLTPDVLKFMKTTYGAVEITPKTDLLEVSRKKSDGFTDTGLFRVLTGEYPKSLDDILSPLESDDVVPLGEPMPLNLDLIAKVSKLVCPDDDKRDAPVFKVFTKGTTDTTKRFNPLILKRKSLVVAVQPMAK